MIRAEGLTVRLDGRTVLDRVDLVIARGEAVALVGPNGSGKTTILRSLLGLVPFDGTAAIDGFDVVEQPVAARSLVGYLPQKPAFGDVTAREALAFVSSVRGAPRALVDRALERVGLLADASRRARTFSGGMLQRLALAAALVGDPPVLLFDEPTASLDADGQRELADTCRALSAEGRTLVLSSHRREEIDRLASRVIRLQSGCVVREPPGSDGPEHLARVIQLGPRRARG